MSCHPHEMNAHATVLANKHGQIELAVVRQSACKACAEKSACGSRQEELKAQKLWLSSDTVLPPGTQVEVAVAEQSVLRAAGLMYGLPLLGFVLGLLLGSFNDYAALAGGLTGLVLGFALAARLARHQTPALRLMTSYGEKP